MSAELFTVATHPTVGLARLQRSLARFGMSATLLGQGEPEFRGYGWRFKMVLRALRKSVAQTVLCCDGYDTICLEPWPEILAKFATFSLPIVFSHEPRTGGGQGLNAGLFIADREAFLAAFEPENLELLFLDHFNDEAQIELVHALHPGRFKIDTHGVLFHTAGPLSPDLVVRENRLVNARTGLAPSFVHGPCRWDLSGIEARLNRLGETQEA